MSHAQSSHGRSGRGDSADCLPEGAEVISRVFAVMLVSAMQQHANDADRLCQPLESFLPIAYKFENDAIRSGGLELVVQAMQRHGEHVSLMELASRFLVYLEEPKAIQRAGGVAPLVSVMKTHENNVTIQMWGAGILMSYLWDDSLSKSAIVEEGIVPAIINAMAVVPNDEALQFLAVGSLHRALEIPNMQAVFMEADGVGVLVGFIKRYGTIPSPSTHLVNLLIVACGSLGIPQEHNVETFRSKLADADGLAAILPMMRHHVENDVLVIRAIGATSMVNGKLQNDTLPKAFTESQGVETIISVLETHSRNGDIAAASIWVIACSMVPYIEAKEETETLLPKSCLPVLGLVMDLHTSNEFLQQGAIAVICSCMMHRHSIGDVEDAFRSAPGVIGSMVVAMHEHVACGGIQHIGCGILMKLSSIDGLRHDPAASVLVASDTVAAVVGAIRNHSADTDVIVPHAILTLCTMAENDDNVKELIVAEGTVSLLENIMQNAESSSKAFKGARLLLDYLTGVKTSIEIGKVVDELA